LLDRLDERYKKYTIMDFEYDPVKSTTNKEKHGIDFEEAQELWSDPEGKGFPARSDDEVRYAIMAKYKEKLWMGFYTMRSGVIRLISVRRAKKGESDLYEG
jgi:uncharacterized DUF497 family protein